MFAFCVDLWIIWDSQDESWANFSLGAMKYNSNPEKLQKAIRSVYEIATSQIDIPGIEVNVIEGK